MVEYIYIYVVSHGQPELSLDIFTGVNGPTSPSFKKVGINKMKVKTIHDVTHFAKLKKIGGCGGRKKKKNLTENTSVAVMFALEN